ncbi:hypothetical protein [Pseudomonas sp. PIC25]|nr:hypothetical protein [Pseudomonas sp. PIC25]
MGQRTHEEFLADYEALRAADQLDEHGIENKALHPPWLTWVR